MLRRAQRPQGGVNSHLNATGRHMDQPGPGFADRGCLTDLKSPLPDVRLAGSRDAIFHTPVNHELSPRAVKVPRDNSLPLQSIRVITENEPPPCILGMHIAR